MGKRKNLSPRKKKAARVAGGVVVFLGAVAALLQACGRDSHVEVRKTLITATTAPTMLVQVPVVVAPPPPEGNEPFASYRIAEAGVRAPDDSIEHKLGRAFFRHCRLHAAADDFPSYLSIAFDDFSAGDAGIRFALGTYRFDLEEIDHTWVGAARTELPSHAPRSHRFLRNNFRIEHHDLAINSAAPDESTATSCRLVHVTASAGREKALWLSGRFRCNDMIADDGQKHDVTGEFSCPLTKTDHRPEGEHVEEIHTHLVRVAVESGTGSVKSTPAGIDCHAPKGENCEKEVEDRAKLTLTATPGETYESIWIDQKEPAKAKSHFRTLHGVTRDHELPIRFQKVSVVVTVTVTADKDAAGTVTSQPEGLHCTAAGGNCQLTVPHGTAVTLRLTPAAGSEVGGPAVRNIGPVVHSMTVLTHFFRTPPTPPAPAPKVIFVEKEKERIDFERPKSPLFFNKSAIQCHNNNGQNCPPPTLDLRGFDPKAFDNFLKKK